MDVEFDTHGMTNNCPLHGEVQYSNCQNCVHYYGYHGFVVHCDFNAAKCKVRMEDWKNDLQ